MGQVQENWLHAHWERVRTERMDRCSSHAESNELVSLGPGRIMCRVLSAFADRMRIEAGSNG